MKIQIIVSEDDGKIIEMKEFSTNGLKVSMAGMILLAIRYLSEISPW